MCRNLSLRALVILFNRSQVSIGRDCTPQSLCYCLFVPHIYVVVLRAHPVRGESHNQRNANGEVATISNLVHSITHSSRVVVMLQVTDE